MERNNVHMPRFAPTRSSCAGWQVFDLTGRLPEAGAIRKFVNNADPEKREKLIDSLMETPVAGLRRRLSTPYLERWTYWFGDLFRSNDGRLNKGRELTNFTVPCWKISPMTRWCGRC